MEAQDKELLLKDLSARLPYGVQAEGLYEEYDDNDKIIQIKTCGFITCITCSIVTIGINDNCKLGTVKPYLRPMSSMTDKKIKNLIKVKILSKYGKEGDYFGFNNIKSIKNIHFGSKYNKWFCDVTFNTIDGKFTTCFSVGRVTWETTIAEIDWLSEHHFDFRGLIEMGLALKAPEGMYNLN